MNAKEQLELTSYAELDHTSVGENIEYLISVYSHRYIFSDEFAIQMEKELDLLLQNYRDNAVVKEEIITPESYTLKVLTWTNEK